MMCAGEFYEKSAREEIQFFDTIAENARTWETNNSVDTTKVHSTPTGGGIHHLRENDDLQAKIANLTRKLEAIELKKVNEVTSVPQAPSVPIGPRVEEPCIICDDPTHSTINCSNLPQVKGEIQIEQANALNYQRKPFNSPYSETYNPGWGKHPNFSWRNEGGPHNLPNNQGPTYQNQGFSNPAPPFQNQGPQGFPVNPNQGFHPSNQGNPNPQPYQPPHKRSLEDIVTQFVQTQESTNTEFRTALNDVRSQITKLTSSMGNFQQEKRKLPSQTIQNPQGQNSVGVSGPSEGTFEHCKAVTTLRSGKVIDKTIQPKEPIQELQSEPIEDDEVSDKPHVPRTNVIDGEPEQDKVSHIPPAPYPHRLRAPKKVNNHSEIYELFKQVKLNIPLLDAIKQIPSYAKFLKDLCTVKRKLGVNKEAFMTEQSTSLIRNNFPLKYKDPGSPTISIVVGNSKLGHALVDLGTSVNLLPYSVYVDLGLGELEPTNITLQLADRSVKIPRGIVKDVLVQVDKFYFPVDFVVLDTQPVVNQGTQFPVILGRPFLATANAIIHCRGGLMTLSFGNMTVNLNIFNVIKGMGDEEDVCEVNMVDSVVQKYLDNVSYDDPLMSCLVSPSWDEEVTTSDSEFLYSIIEHNEVLEVNGWAPKFEPLPPIEDRALPSKERPPKLELKPLPSHLKYAFLGIEETFPVIISSSLELDQENKLLEILRTHQTALGWTIADIKGISPLICTHRIHLEEDVKPSRQLQRRLNPIMKEVVKKEVLKILDVGVIYPIADSKWVSPTQVIPKKSGVTVVANENNELIPTCVTSGWRVCIDYRKLNAGTRKDHFPLPFVDQMLERVAGHEFYCFLDWYSRYNQIEIALEDQEKTTFICPFVTFAYRKMPFGLCNAPGTFQRCMMGIFSDMIEIILEIFMDDFSVFGDSYEGCLENLRKVLERCQEKNLVLNWEKCHFMVTQGIVLGHIVSKNGIEVDKAKVELISNLPTPQGLKCRKYRPKYRRYFVYRKPTKRFLKH